jgi:hypothetical protein
MDQTLGTLEECVKNVMSAIIGVEWNVCGCLWPHPRLLINLLF